MKAAVAEKSARSERDDRRAAILKIAHVAFLADGYAATSMSMIAARLGGSKATLYNYFKSKEELFIAVIDSKCEEVQSLVYAAEIQSGDFKIALTDFGRQFLQFGLGDEAITTYRLVAAECVRFPEIGQALYRSGMQRGVNRLAENFARAMQSGYLKSADPAIAAEQFFSLCLSRIHHGRLWNVIPELSPKEIAEQTEQAVTTFLAAYGPDR